MATKSMKAMKAIKAMKARKGMKVVKAMKVMKALKTLRQDRSHECQMRKRLDRGKEYAKANTAKRDQCNDAIELGMKHQKEMEDEIKSNWNDGYYQGYDDGYADGDEDVYIDAYTKGYNDGLWGGPPDYTRTSPPPSEEGSCAGCMLVLAECSCTLV